MRSANIFYGEVLAGELVETNDGEYEFTYNESYVKNHPNQFYDAGTKGTL